MSPTYAAKEKMCDAMIDSLAFMVAHFRLKLVLRQQFVSISASLREVVLDHLCASPTLATVAHNRSWPVSSPVAQRERDSQFLLAIVPFAGPAARPSTHHRPVRELRFSDWRGTRRASSLVACIRRKHHFTAGAKSCQRRRLSLMSSWLGTCSAATVSIRRCVGR